MFEGIQSVLLGLVALIHLLPTVGVTGAKRLEGLYGVTLDDPALVVLMRHRAVLFGIVGGLMAAGALVPAWRPMALGVGWVSVVSFLWIARGTTHPGLARVRTADQLALVALIGATTLQFVP